MYDKNCGEKMFGRKMYPAPEKNLADQAAFKGMGGKWLSFGIKDPDLYAKKIMLGACPMKFSPQVLT